MDLKAEWSRRLDYWMLALTEDFYLPLGEICFEGFETFEQLGREVAAKQEFKPMPVGTEWGQTWQYCWLRSKIVLPKAAEGNVIVMNLNPGGESTLFVNNQEFGTKRAEWVTIPHHYFSDNFLTESGKKGESFDLLIESYAGHYYPESVFGGVATGPVLPGSYQDPKEGKYRTRIDKSTFGIWNEDAYQLWLDVKVLSEIMGSLSDGNIRACKIAEGLKQFTLAVDFEQDRDKRILEYKAARKKLAPLLMAKNGSTSATIYAIGNAHLDVAWLWPIQETVRKTARTFAQQLRLIEKYPDYKFLQSQPHTYKMCKDSYPDLYERIKKAVKKGNWICEGAMWVEPDTNMVSGESLIRQLLYGKKFYRDEFGIECEILWLPDTFGYSAALPQILKGFDVKYLVTQKIFWSYNQGEQFPYHYFNWKGSDGSQVVAYLPTDYTYKTNPKAVIDVWDNRVQKDGLDKFLYPYGYGDGGGGPSRDYVEYAIREKDIEGVPKVKMAHPIELFRDLENEGGAEHTYNGELYFSCHRGVYTSQAGVKKGNRRSEFALREAEIWCSIAMIANNFEYPKTVFEEEWKKVLLNQFHDILPGSSIHRVYEEAAILHDEVINKSTELAKQSASAIAHTGSAEANAVSVFNSLSWERKAIVELPMRFAEGAKDSKEQTLALKVLPDKVLAEVTIPACGYETIVPSNKSKEPDNAAKAFLDSNGAVLENGLIRANFDANGEISSFIIKSSGREFVQSPMNHFTLFKDVPRLFDAWDIDSPYEQQEIELDAKANIELISNHPLESIIKISKTIGNSELEQFVSIKADSRRIEFDTKIEWNELHRLLKVSFPVNVYVEEGINEIQFGYIKRPSHRSRQYDKDRFEVCNHRYTALCDENHGAAVLNDCKYGVSMLENTISLTLLKAASSPDMRADNGTHTFTYAFSPWEGTWFDSDIVRQGYELNLQPTLTEGGSGNKSFFSIENADNIIIDTVKAAEDGSGDVIVRLYESKKADTVCSLIYPNSLVSVKECNMEEKILGNLEADGGSVRLGFRAFEVKTLRFSLK